MPLRWKVCGITREQDAIEAVRLGADAIGLVFWSGSARCVGVERAAAIGRVLPEATWRFGVFVNEDPARIAAVVEAVRLDFVQLSGDEPPEIVASLPRHAFKAIRLEPGVSPQEALRRADLYPECTLLVDAAGGYGGTGQSADPAAAAAVARKHRLMLAGGLSADNVADAVRAVRPWAVDVSSGVEASPGVKDPDRLSAFARALEPFR